MLSFQDQLQVAQEIMQHAERIVTLTGAGISTESGIPDFRSPGSIWLEQPPVSYKDFISKAEARQLYWQTRRNLSGQVAGAKPNAAHYALAAFPSGSANRDPRRVARRHVSASMSSARLRHNCARRANVDSIQ